MMEKKSLPELYEKLEVKKNKKLSSYIPEIIEGIAITLAFLYFKNQHAIEEGMLITFFLVLVKKLKNANAIVKIQKSIIDILEEKQDNKKNNTKKIK